jgi:hypothetical protein
MFMNKPDEKAVQYVASLLSLKRIDVAQRAVTALSKSQSLSPGTIEVISKMVASARDKVQPR